MIRDDVLSVESLNKFLDDELNPSQRVEILEAMRRDEGLGHRVCELMRIKDSVRIAYDDLPQPVQNNKTWQRSCKSRMVRNGIAAMLLLAVGTLAGLVIGPQLKYNQITGPYSAYLASARVNQSDRMIVHVSESDPARFSDIMLFLSNLLDERASDNVQIEVIANAGGIDFMRTDVSPYKAELVAMMNAHPNIHFIACVNTIRRLKNKGIEPGMLQGIQTDKAAIDHIVERLQSGWSYIKVGTEFKSGMERERIDL